jgi:tRNA dimethylallyltransferase
MLAIIGQTAVGKTKIAIEVASQINGEIISADSMCVYRYMDIGTAKPTLADRKKVPHHLIDVVDPDYPFSVSDYLTLANKAIDEIISRGKTPILCGGTGLYLRAIFEGFGLPIVGKNDKFREEYFQKAEKEGTKRIFEELKKVDPVSAQRIHPHDAKRIIRALEVYKLTGVPISKLQRKGHALGILGQNLTDDGRQMTNDKGLIIGLNLPREELHKRIDTRVDQMFKDGLVNEVKGLLEKDYHKNLTSMQALGYKESIDFLEDKMTFSELVKLVKKKTRQFAKRQMTWFRSFHDVKWVDASQRATDLIVNYFRDTSVNL